MSIHTSAPATSEPSAEQPQAPVSVAHPAGGAIPSLAPIAALCAIARLHHVAADPATLAHQLGLSGSELLLLQALLSGASNKQIGRELGKSEFTVRNQLSVAFQKIGVANRMQAAFWFRAYLVAQEERGIGISVPLSGTKVGLRINGCR